MTININLAYADETPSSTQTKIPAAWVWEIKSANRTIYLLGEMHSFYNIKSNAVNFELGNQIYEKTVFTFTEQETTGINSPYFTKKLSTNLGPVMWQKLDELLANQLLEKLKKPEEISKLRVQLMSEFDSATIPAAEATIRKFAYISHSLKTKTKLDGVKGLMYRFYDTNRKKDQGKLISLEDSYSSDASWYSTCDTDDLAQAYIEAAMSTFDSSIFWGTDKVMNLQKLYSANSTNLNDFTNYWLSNYPGAKIMYKCNIIPRNKVWFKTLVKLMHENGAPISVIVGLAHVSGDEGLLEMFKKNGATSIRRIYSLED